MFFPCYISELRTIWKFFLYIFWKHFDFIKRMIQREKCDLTSKFYFKSEIATKPERNI